MRDRTLTPDDREQLGADLSAYLDGELNPRRAEEIERLLAESAEARRVLEDLRAISERLGELPKMNAPEDLARSASSATGRRGAHATGGLPARADTGGKLPVARVNRARVYRLVTRISASAAVIALCAFAGWTFLERGAPEGARPARPIERLARTDAAADSDAAPALALRELKSLGYVGSDSERAEIGEEFAKTPAASLARAEPQVAAADTAAPSAPLPASPTIAAGPQVNIVITPRNAAEYNGALLAVAQWPPVGDEATKLHTFTRRGGAAGGGRAIDAMMTRDITIHVPPDQVNLVLADLDRQAPRQVQATMSFNSHDMTLVRQMVTPPAERRLDALAESDVAVDDSEERPASDPALALGRNAESAEESSGPRSARGGGGGRGRVTRSPAARQRGGFGGGAIDKGGESAVTPGRKQPALARKKTDDGEDAAETQPAAKASAPADRAAQLDAELRDTYEQALAAVFREEGDERLIEASPLLGQSIETQHVTLQVRLLPPPAATQPASQPTGAGADAP